MVVRGEFHDPTALAQGQNKNTGAWWAPERACIFWEKGITLAPRIR